MFLYRYILHHSTQCHMMRTDISHFFVYEPMISGPNMLIVKRYRKNKDLYETWNGCLRLLFLYPVLM